MDKPKLSKRELAALEHYTLHEWSPPARNVGGPEALRKLVAAGLIADRICSYHRPKRGEVWPAGHEFATTHTGRAALAAHKEAAPG
jgi:hypothetical protein